MGLEFMLSARTNLIHEKHKRPENDIPHNS